MESPILERSVRFESECVLIPEHLYSQKKQILSRPKIVSKSWSLPIGWSTAPNHPALASNASLDDERDKERGRKLTVILPSFTKSKKAQPSPPPPLSPCLRKSERSNSLSVRSPTRGPAETLHRTASLPSGRPLPTVPLRPCCTACYEAVEAYLASPSTSPEKMSTGAMLRHASDHHRDHHRPGMLFPSPVKGCHKLSLVRVDEVDMKGTAGGGDVGMECLKEENEPVQEPESDEEQLFPLPSPKRTPVSSPISSPTASQINLSLKTSLPTETSTSTLNSTTSPTTPKRSSPLCAPCVYPIPTPASPEIIGPDPDELPPQPHSHHHHSHNPHSSTDRRSSVSSSNNGSHANSNANGDSPGTPGKRRRSSLSAFGESFSRGGAAILRGVGEVVNGVSGSGSSIMV
ncbi:hypothetical protein SISNIDRAFT_457768 [Sistotremastrum niveocremeum HHB9708]|uniref:Uncharacterized protein n=1 Tax=Sistotremastrum niveocremeum HHB9708 TaxID=1314777 RepID=A0A164R4S2_9AGAM|nr:hypothetical protein SISNIDRAFT_457768 [Sistotremastrum niveocremeum HHB9708]